MTQVFVYGSNTQGIDGGGAALEAKIKHKRPAGIPIGLYGTSYGIVTKHLPKGQRSVPLMLIQAQIFTLLEYVKIRTDLIFNVTRIGCGHAGFLESEIAPMFGRLTSLPNNIILCSEFIEWIEKNNP